MRRAILMLFSFLLAMEALVGAPRSHGAAPVPEEPIRITSDRLEGDNIAGTLIFLGSVVARHGDVTLYARKLILFRSEKEKEIERVEASGGVRIVQGDRVATGENAVYFNQEGKIVLTGSPKVHQGEDVIEGEEITVFLNEEKSLVDGREGSRVNAIFHPQGKKP